jgi:hypothetical protein
MESNPAKRSHGEANEEPAAGPGGMDAETQQLAKRLKLDMPTSATDSALPYGQNGAALGASLGMILPPLPGVSTATPVMPLLSMPGVPGGAMNGAPAGLSGLPPLPVAPSAMETPAYPTNTPFTQPLETPSALPMGTGSPASALGHLASPGLGMGAGIPAVSGQPLMPQGTPLMIPSSSAGHGGPVIPSVSGAPSLAGMTPEQQQRAQMAARHNDAQMMQHQAGLRAQVCHRICTHTLYSTALTAKTSFSIFPTPHIVGSNYLTHEPIARFGILQAAAAAAAGQPGGPQAPTQEAQSERRRKAIQEQLLLLIHAHKCKDQTGSCTIAHCGTMKEVLMHMSACKRGRNCQ